MAQLQMGDTDNAHNIDPFRYPRDWDFGTHQLATVANTFNLPFNHHRPLRLPERNCLEPHAVCDGHRFRRRRREKECELILCSRLQVGAKTRAHVFTFSPHSLTLCRKKSFNIWHMKMDLLRLFRISHQLRERLM